MSFGIFGSAQQAGNHQGQSWERNNSKKNEAKAEAIAAEGLGVAVAGIAAVVQARKEIAALVAVRKALTDALAKVAPSHPLNDKELRNKIYEKAYDEA